MSLLNGIVSKYPALGQLIRYGVVGVVNNSLLYLGYLLIVYAGVGSKFSMTLMYLAGVIVGFLANYRWTFAQGKNHGALVRYILMHMFGYLINFLLLLIFVDGLGNPHQVVQVIAILVVAAYGFVTCKYYVFRASAKQV
ncbi:hypothetical protein CS078_16945 [Pseudomonas prosekii]|uniref:GtrA/DPMS transmembrane domain-containing protein n=1 Tax=Pseudomonas prosekii TaxID=1148509 RepID=A0A3L8CIQ5_9PSED|nr:GtrA family protein [Pseudomonas prosekii]RLU08175.1 hypothetical protein CS078_16945 [Pseudomonas prosekii]RLU11675.1 hypothetical protein CS076_09855 [Pseudomonas prosekii]